MASVTMRVEVFTFSTELQRVTDEVRRAAAGEWRRLDGLHHAWAGGTSIGACLRDFLRRFGERVVGRDTVVMIASDGLDVGAPETLRDAMRELHRRSAALRLAESAARDAGLRADRERHARRPAVRRHVSPASTTRSRSRGSRVSCASEPDRRHTGTSAVPPLLLAACRDTIGVLWPGFDLVSATAIVLRWANGREFGSADAA